MAKVKIIRLLDRSGSMRGRESSVVEGNNEFIAKLRGTQTDDEVLISTGLFDTHGNEPAVQWLETDVPLTEAMEFADGDYVPRGLTPLRDAISEGINYTRDADRAMIVITTDGHDTSSTEITTEGLRKLVVNEEKAGTEFIYLGANVDAFSETANIGITRGAASKGWSGSAAGAKNAATYAGVMASSFAAGPESYARTTRRSRSISSLADDSTAFEAQLRSLTDDDSDGEVA